MRLLRHYRNPVMAAQIQFKHLEITNVCHFANMFIAWLLLSQVCIVLLLFTLVIIGQYQDIFITSSRLMIYITEIITLVIDRNMFA